LTDIQNERLVVRIWKSGSEVKDRSTSLRSDSRIKRDEGQDKLFKAAQQRSKQQGCVQVQRYAAEDAPADISARRFEAWKHWSAGQSAARCGNPRAESFADS